MHLIVAELLNTSMDLAAVHRRIYDSHSEIRLRFLGYMLKDKLVVRREFNTAYITVTQQELRDYDSKTRRYRGPGQLCAQH
ncbi:MAG: hypothetical protein WKG07_02985 [Hymenobacter sp.]